MANVKNNASAQETQRRLLEAAGEVFAEHGFHSATIKEITDRAGASVAAVNYHFSDKAELYRAVLKRIEEEASRIIPPEELLTGNAETQFRTFVRHMTMTMLGRGQTAWERLLLAREFARPSPELASLLSTVAVPLNRRLSAIIGLILNRDPEDPSVAMATISVIAQSVYFLQHYHHLDQLYPQLATRPSNEAIAKHVADFSYQALRGK